MLEEHPRVREYLTVAAILIAIGVIEGRNVLALLVFNLGIGDFNYTSLPFTEMERFHYFPLVVFDWMKIPFPLAIGLLMMGYHVLGGLFAYALSKQYFVPRQPDRYRLHFVVPLLASIAYMMFPWNAFGDNFPTLVLVRAFSPLVILLLLLAIRRGSLRYSVLSGLSLSVLTLADPRSALFLIPISLMMVTIPEVLVKSTSWKRATKVNLAFGLSSFVGLGVQALYRLPGIVASDSGIRSSSGVVATLNPNSFIPNFVYANPLNYLAGVSYEGTYRDFFIYTTHFGDLIPLVTMISASLFIFIIIYPYFLTDKDERLRSLIIISFMVVSVALFSILPGGDLPFLLNSLIRSDYVRDSSILTAVLLMFRKTRFANMVMILSLVPLLTMSLGAFLYWIQGRRWDLKSLLRPKVLCVFIVLALVLSSLLIWAVPQVSRGNGVQFYGGQTFEITNEALDLSSVVAQINRDPTVDKILVIQPVNEGLPNMYTLQDIEGGTVQYLVHYVVDTMYSPIIQDGDYAFMWQVLHSLGVRYVVVDGYAIDDYYSEEGSGKVYTPAYPEIVSGLSNSTLFEQVAEKNRITAFELLEATSSGQAGLFVLGGLEDYRSAYPFLSSQTSYSYLPVTLDSYFSLDSVDQLPNWPILVGSHKTMDDLDASVAMLQSQGTVLTPASWVLNEWDPYSNWSPGYIQDRIGGKWSPILQEVTNYEWSFSYAPDYGYAYTMGATDTISYGQSFDPGQYVILIRTMYSSAGGEISLGVNGRSVDLKTMWANESSEFLWTNIGTFDLSGDTKFTLSNVEGTNAVNVILAIPVDEWEEAQQTGEKFVQNRTVIQLADPNRFEWDATSNQSVSTISVLRNGQYNISLQGEDAQNILLDQGGLLEIDDLNGTVELTKGQVQVIFRDSLITIYQEAFERLQWIFSPGVSTIDSPTLDFWGRLDDDERVGGNYSLNLTTSTSKAGYWSNVVSGPIRVAPGEQYLFNIQMKWNNSVQSHVAIDGIRSNGQIYRLAEIMHGQDGDGNWTSFSKLVQVPQDTTRIRVVLNAGWVNNTALVGATTWFDNLTIQKMVNKNSTLILYEGDLVATDGLTVAQETVESNGYSNQYSFTFQGSGWALCEVPEEYYSTSLTIKATEAKVLTLPVFYTTTGLLVSGEGDASVVLEDLSKTEMNDLGLYTFAIIIGVAATVLITIAYDWNRNRVGPGSAARTEAEKKEEKDDGHSKV